MRNEAIIGFFSNDAYNQEFQRGLTSSRETHLQHLAQVYAAQQAMEQLVEMKILKTGEKGYQLSQPIQILNPQIITTDGRLIVEMTGCWTRTLEQSQSIIGFANPFILGLRHLKQTGLYFDTRPRVEANTSPNLYTYRNPDERVLVADPSQNHILVNVYSEIDNAARYVSRFILERATLHGFRKHTKPLLEVDDDNQPHLLCLWISGPNKKNVKANSIVIPQYFRFLKELLVQPTQPNTVLIDRNQFNSDKAFQRAFVEVFNSVSPQKINL